MSYREENGEVILTMSRYDYLFLTRLVSHVMCSEGERAAPSTKEFLNRLNSGNPNYTPYQVEEKKN